MSSGCGPTPNNAGRFEDGVQAVVGALGVSPGPGWEVSSSAAGLLVGREQDVVTAHGQLLRPEVRLLTLTGTGGVGKTSLAVALAQLMARRFRDGVFFVDLSPLADPALFATAVGRVLGLRESGRQRLSTTLPRYLRDRQVLLVLDNFEHLLAAADEVRSLLVDCPAVRVLVTSRAPLGVPGEHELPVDPLTVPDLLTSPAVDEMAVDEVAAAAAVALFVRRAQAVRPAFALCAENAATVAEICVRLDGLPLAIELAAARVKALGVEQILGRLRDRFRLLAAPTRVAPDRHRSLRRAVDWSYGLLNERERALFRSLSVFAGGWELEAAEAVCPRDRAGVVSVAPEEVVDLLARLVDHSMVVAEARAGRARYRLLETLRQYATERLGESGEQQHFKERHRSWFLRLAEEAEATIAQPGEADRLDGLQRDLDNLRAALDYSMAPGVDPEPGLRLAGALFRFWDVRGYLGEGFDRLTGLLDRPEAAAPTVGRAKALNALGTVALARADQDLARAALEESALLGRRLGGGRLEIWPVSMLAFQAFLAGEQERARATAERTHALAVDADDEALQIRGYCARGIVVANGGDRPQGWSLLEQALAIARRLGSTWGTANVLYLMGWVALLDRDAERASALEVEALGLLWTLGDRRTVADSLDVLACAAMQSGHPQRVPWLFGVTERLREMTGAGRPPYLHDACDEAVANARAELGAARFEAGWAAGRGFTLTREIGALVDALAALDIGQLGAGSVPLLTGREAQIVGLVVAGLTNRQIAAALVISERTAERHLENVRVKLGVTSRAQIAAWAVRQGLVDDGGRSGGAVGYRRRGPWR